MEGEDFLPPTQVSGSSQYFSQAIPRASGAAVQPPRVEVAEPSASIRAPTSLHLPGVWSGFDPPMASQAFVPLGTPAEIAPPPPAAQCRVESGAVGRTCGQSDRLLISNVYPPTYQTIFSSKFTAFNKLQSECFASVAHSDENIVISAPTGSGKTCIFEMAIIRLLQSQRNVSPNLGTTKNFDKTKKIVYIAPSKALCDERLSDWDNKFARLGLKVGRVTGDTMVRESLRVIAASHVILTTPEKWDSITRKWTNNLYLLGSVSLLMIDEVHLIGDKNRGATLEAVVTRMKTVRRTIEERAASTATANKKILSASTMRMIAVSATLPNVSDIGAFMCAPPSCTFCFDHSYRPVPLAIHVKSCGSCRNEYFFDKSLNEYVPKYIATYSEGKPSLVFCHSKKDTEVLSRALGASGRHVDSPQKRTALLQGASNASDETLKQCIQKGTAFHHAGLAQSDRHLVEALFLSGKLAVVCATSTLAMGVNLPAHLVVIKGTRAWRGGGTGHQDVDIGVLTQMIGRAGRPGLDTTGVAVIMTDESRRTMVEKRMLGSEVVESMLR